MNDANSYDSHDPRAQQALLAAGVPGSELRYDPENGWLVSAAGVRKLIAEGAGTREGRVRTSRMLAEAEKQFRRS